MQEIRRSFPVSAVSVPDSVVSVSVLYRDPTIDYALLNYSSLTLQTGTPEREKGQGMQTLLKGTDKILNMLKSIPWTSCAKFLPITFLALHLRSHYILIRVRFLQLTVPQRVLLSLTKDTLKTYCYVIFFILKGHFCPLARPSKRQGEQLALCPPPSFGVPGYKPKTIPVFSPFACLPPPPQYNVEYMPSGYDAQANIASAKSRSPVLISWQRWGLIFFITH